MYYHTHSSDGNKCIVLYYALFPGIYEEQCRHLFVSNKHSCPICSKVCLKRLIGLRLAIGGLQMAAGSFHQLLDGFFPCYSLTHGLT